MAAKMSKLTFSCFHSPFEVRIDENLSRQGWHDRCWSISWASLHRRIATGYCILVEKSLTNHRRPNWWSRVHKIVVEEVWSILRWKAGSHRSLLWSRPALHHVGWLSHDRTRLALKWHLLLVLWSHRVPSRRLVGPPLKLLSERLSWGYRLGLRDLLILL